MKKIFNFLICFTISMFIFAPTANAWTWDTHSNIVKAVYNNLPPDAQQKLNLKVMEDASNVPDRVFHDTSAHHYPPSYTRANYWLDAAKTAYNRGDYTSASYDLGVASHYISDSFSAPHYVTGEGDLHEVYEKQANSLTPVPSLINGDLNSVMNQGKIQGPISWDTWYSSRSSSIVQSDLNNGASAVLLGIDSTLLDYGSFNFDFPVFQGSSQLVVASYKSPDVSFFTNQKLVSSPSNGHVTEAQNHLMGSFLPFVGITILLIFGGLIIMRRRFLS